MSRTIVRPAQFARMGSFASRMADVGGVDPELAHQVQELAFLRDRRVDDRRGLQAVAQRLVVEHERMRRRHQPPVDVPVVDQIVAHCLFFVAPAPSYRAGRNASTKGQ